MNIEDIYIYIYSRCYKYTRGLYRTFYRYIVDDVCIHELFYLYRKCYMYIQKVKILYMYIYIYPFRAQNFSLFTDLTDLVKGWGRRLIA